MNSNHTAASLKNFETRIANTFNEGKIKAPVHLYDGNEEQMIEAFSPVKPQDWICCSWRSHFQCLLKGVSESELEEAILSGRSITLCFLKHRILSSAIVGGIIPIATGIAMGIKLNNGKETVHCFVGEMTAETGIFHEARKYALGHNLPIRWIIEDNTKSVCTDTKKTWGGSLTDWKNSDDVFYYQYDSKYPHAGAGQRVQF